MKSKPGQRKRHLWITDPWDTLDHPTDTTLRLMNEAAKLGVSQYWCDVKTIRLAPGSRTGPRGSAARVVLDARELVSVGQWGPFNAYSPLEFATLHYRTDPPVDLAYLHPLQLLALELRNSKKSQLINPLNVLLGHNEKIEATALGDLMPPSMVSCQWPYLCEFGKAQGRTVLKPLHEAQSHGIELLDWRSPDGIENAKFKLSGATHNFQTPIILQTYLEGIAQGETRLWFLDGKLLAHVKKLPVTGDFRVNIDQGSRLAVSTLNPHEKKAATRISAHLRSLKIRLAAVDLIDHLITDFNFTSPGLIPLMEELLGENLALPIVRALFGLREK